MATRLIVDSAFTDVVTYYQTFPSEPTDKAGAPMDVLIPVDKADKLKPLTLETLLARMNAVPTTEKSLLLVCHGTPAGLAIPLVAGSSDLMDEFNLKLLMMLGKTAARYKALFSLPIPQRTGELKQLLADMKLPDGTAVLPSMPEETFDYNQRLVHYLMARFSGQRTPFPVADDVQVVTPPPPSAGVKASFALQFPANTGPKTHSLFPSDVAKIKTEFESLSTVGKNNVFVNGNPGGPFTFTFVRDQGGKVQPLMGILGGGSVTQRARLVESGLHVKALTGFKSAQQFDNLIAARNAVQNKFDRLDFRSCNTGKSKTALEAIHDFFGCKTVCAPDVVSFNISMKVIVDANFDKNYDKNDSAQTNRDIMHGRAAVKLDNGTNVDTRLALADVPKSRRFDEDKARAGDEVFIRLWATRIHPRGQGFGHQFFGWLRAISASYVIQFAKDKINKNVSRWKNQDFLPMSALWLVNDLNMPATSAAPPIVAPQNGASPLTTAPPPPLPTFALPLDPEYSKHLISFP